MPRSRWLIIPTAMLIAFAFALYVSQREYGPVQTLLPPPGVPRDVPDCDLTTPGTAWATHTIYSAVIGADGIEVADLDGDGDLDVVSPFEQAADVVVCLQGSISSWSCVTIDTNLPSAEGASFGDFDKDGRIDVCAVGQTGTVRLYFRPDNVADILNAGSWVTTDLTAFEVLTKGWMQCRAADINGDTDTDVILGGTTQTLDGELAWALAPDTGKRTGATWTRTVIVAATGRVMSVHPFDPDGDLDVDVIYTNRATPGTVGSIWMENDVGDGSAWTAHPIDGAGSNPRMMFDLSNYDDDADSLDYVTGLDGSWTVLRYDYVDTEKWIKTFIPNPGTVGVFQWGALKDLNLDGYPDIIASFSGATTGLSALVWLKAPYWTRGEIGGLAGAITQKFDNCYFGDLDNDGDYDGICSDQGNEIDSARGLIVMVNPCL